MSKKKSNKSFLDIIQEQRVESKKRTKFRGTFLEYLELIKKNPDIAKLAHKRLCERATHLR